MKNLKSEKGAITLFVLLACLFFVMSLLGVYNYVQNRNQASNSEYEKVKENYEKDIGNEEKLYESNIKPATLADLIDGDYVEYGVTYTDIYMGYEYTERNGWRLLEANQNSENSELLDIKLISTGIPARLYYYASTVKNFESDGTIGKWGGTSTQRREYAKSFYLSKLTNDDNDNDNNNMYAAAGLYYNFERIKFKVNPESVDSTYYNYGYYKNIAGKTTEESCGSIFIDNSVESKITEIREVTLEDLTGQTEFSTSYTDKEGLYILQNLSSSKNASDYGVNTYSYSTGGSYWLASPNDSGANSLYGVSNTGGISLSNDGKYGIRPVISISGVKLIKNGGVWQIVE